MSKEMLNFMQVESANQSTLKIFQIINNKLIDHCHSTKQRVISSHNIPFLEFCSTTPDFLKFYRIKDGYF